MAREVYIGTYYQSHPTATAERTRPSYLVLLPSWIHPIIPCASAILDPSHHTLRFCHLGSIPSYLALLPSWIHPIIPCAAAILDPSHHTLRFCHLGSIPSYIALPPSWIHPSIPCASAILDPSHHTLRFCHLGSIPSYLALLPSWIHPIIPWYSAILDPSHHVHVISSHSNSLLFRRPLLHINTFFTSCRSLFPAQVKRSIPAVENWLAPEGVRRSIRSLTHQLVDRFCFWCCREHFIVFQCLFEWFDLLLWNCHLNFICYCEIVIWTLFVRVWFWALALLIMVLRTRVIHNGFGHLLYS